MLPTNKLCRRLYPVDSTPDTLAYPRMKNDGTDAVGSVKAALDVSRAFSYSCG